MNKRELRLDKYGISNKRYKELCGFCEQYPEWKQFLENKNGEPGSPKITDMPKAPLHNSDTVGDLAVRRVELEKKCKIVEDTAKKADPEYWKQLIEAVCYEVSVTYLQQNRSYYMSKSAFYERRRYFFYLLDKEKV